MSLRQFRHFISRLSNEEKVLSISAIGFMTSCFLPWYSSINNFQEATQIEYGLTGEIGIIGFICFLFGGIGMSILLSKYFNLPIPQIKGNKDKVIFLIMSQAAFLFLLALAMYSKKSLGFTNAEIRFGLYSALGFACFALFSAYAQLQKNEKMQAESLIDIKQEMEARAEALDHQSYPQNETSTYETKPEQTQFFSEIELSDIKRVEKEEMAQNKANPQRNFFMKEAGIEKEEIPKEF